MSWTPHISLLKSYAELLALQDNLVASPLESKEHETALNKGHETVLNKEHEAALDKEVLFLSYNSRSVKPGTLFICKGAHFEVAYLIAAAQAGAIAYISQTDYSEELAAAGAEVLPALVVHDVRSAIADAAALYYQGLLDKLTLIGFTGTKGKSTTTYMLRSILDSWLVKQGKAKSAFLSSIENYDGKSCERSRLTTQETLELYEHFVNAVEAGIEYLTMEVSSQALKYHRTRGLHFEVAGFLNIGEDHISPIEHPTHEDYLASKLAIFEQCNTAVYNRGTQELLRVEQAAAHAERVVTFERSADSTEHSDILSTPKAHNEATHALDAHVETSSIPAIFASQIESNEQGLSFTASAPSWEEHFTLPMAGLFNVENALAALAAADALGISVEHMQEGLAKCEVSGRMQLVEGPDNKLIIIDYAHNKLSFETLFSTVHKDYPSRPIVCVFGATGSKGVERRVELPAVAAQYAQMIYITEDDPGDEPLADINQHIASVVEAAGKEYLIVEDRNEAIKRALFDAPKGSLVLVLGKGHETLMRRGSECVTVPTDKERVERILAGDA